MADTGSNSGLPWLTEKGLLERFQAAEVPFLQ